MKRTVRIVLLLLVMSIVWGTAIAAPAGDYETARKYYFSGKYKEAVRHLEKYIQQKPDASAYYMMGYALYELKRFDEASEYFRDAYLIDPTYSPLPPSETREREVKPTKVRPKPVPAVQEGAAQEKRTAPGDVPQAARAAEPAKPEQTRPVTASPEANKAVAPQAEPAKPQAQQKPSPAVTPAAPAPAAPQPPAGMPPVPMPKQTLPPGMGKEVGGLALLMGSLFAGFALVFLGVGLAFYLFFSYCLYRIATKLNCPASWTAWVPLLNMWPVVGSAGKPWWWLILLFIPLVGIAVWVYLWMCITENLGKNKWIALLLQITGIGYLILSPWLAFSKGPEAALPEPVELE